MNNIQSNIFSSIEKNKGNGWGIKQLVHERHDQASEKIILRILKTICNFIMENTKKKFSRKAGRECKKQRNLCV